MNDRIDYGCRQGRWASDGTHLHDLRIGGLFSVGGRDGKVVTKGSGSVKVRWLKQEVRVIRYSDGSERTQKSNAIGLIAPCTEVTTKQAPNAQRRLL